MWNPVRWTVRWVRKTTLEQGPVSNNLQLCTSKHLGDYQWLAMGVVVFLAFGVGLLITAGEPDPSKSIMSTIAYALITTAVTMFNWVYQSANRRLGVVDLFASEISAICKVSIVADFARKSIVMRNAADATDTQVPRSFDTKESYTPVYDKGPEDLQQLDSNVVSSVTQFYTYRKAMIDCLHSALAQTKRETAVPQYDQMIYMQFLMYECARTAIRELIEFEPDKAENLVTVLCSELPLVTFLIRRHRDDSETAFLYRRLCLRIEGYRHGVKALLKEIDQKAKSKSKAVRKGWSKAITTSDELRIRFREFKSETEREWRQCLSDEARRETSDVPDPRQPPLQQAA